MITLELGVRFLLVLYDFYFEQRRETELVAERMAANVKSIMLNAGGPVAARTVYPILKKDLAELGFEVAVVPSKMTVSSVESVFDFTPQGIPPQWSEGTHHEATVELKTETFCQQCHIEAKIGEVLGHVTVRKTLMAHVVHWWEEARVAGTIGMVNILLHTIVLYILLKVRMGPVLALRDAIAQLAKAGSNLSVRADVLSRDEFGQLARDINMFVERIAHITEDVLLVLGKLQDLNERLYRLRGKMDDKAHKLERKVDGATELALREGGQLGLVSGEWDRTVDALSAVLSELAARENVGVDACDQLKQAVAAWREIAAKTRDSGIRREAVTGSLVEIGQELDDLSHQIADMAVFEERMTAVAREGETLLRRLRPDEVAEASAQDDAHDPDLAASTAM